ncbi:MAG: RNA methyltransferase, partial [bacterium]|nr:RNA methyltransferase [bacterium]
MLIILVEPGEPANIGAAARALKTMGLARLAFVRPHCDPHSDAARWLAHGSSDILASAQTFSSIPEAAQNCALIGAFPARPRRAPLPPAIPVDEFVRLCHAALPSPSAAVFGSEAHGLSNDDLALCTHLVFIPNATRHPSLNLAQAVMIACYEYYRQTLSPPPPT